MTFWFSKFDNYNNIPNDYLCISISSKAPITFNRKNAIVPFDGIFTPPISLIEENIEENYYNLINNKMRKCGYNGFNDYIYKLENFYNNEFFHDDNDKVIKYKNIVFMYKEEDKNYIEYLKKLFNNFDILLNKFTISTLNNTLF